MVPRWCIGVLAAVVVAGCGADDDDAGDLTVAAASSVQNAIRACAPDVRASFAGSDELAAQVRQGLPVDVFLAANTGRPLASCTPSTFGSGRPTLPSCTVGNTTVRVSV